MTLDRNGGLRLRPTHYAEMRFAMNFDDTPQEAEFRATARKWIDANAPKDLEAEL